MKVTDYSLLYLEKKGSHDGVAYEEPTHSHIAEYECDGDSAAVLNPCLQGRGGQGLRRAAV